MISSKGTSYVVQLSLEFIVSMLVSQFRAIKLGLTSALWNMTGSKGSVLLGRWQQRHTRRVGVYDIYLDKQQNL